MILYIIRTYYMESINDEPNNNPIVKNSIRISNPNRGSNFRNPAISREDDDIDFSISDSYSIGSEDTILNKKNN